MLGNELIEALGAEGEGRDFSSVQGVCERSCPMFVAGKYPAFNIVATGLALASDFPITGSAYLSTKPNAGDSTGYLSILSPDCSTLIASTYFGGGQFAIPTSLVLGSADHRNRLRCRARPGRRDDRAASFGFVPRTCAGNRFGRGRRGYATFPISTSAVDWETLIDIKAAAR